MSKDAIESCHLKFCRNSLGINKRETCFAIYGEIGRFPLAIEAVINSIKFMYRLHHLPKSSLLYHAYRDMSLSITKHPWLMNITQLLDIGSINLSKCTLTKIIQTIKSMLKQQFKDFWKSKLFDDKNTANGNKLRNYRTYKTTFEREDYLDMQSQTLRSNFSRLRLSAHKLHIETGRYVNKNERKPPEERKCEYCSEDTCEDEFHFVIECQLYQDYRHDLFANIESKFPFFTEYDEQTRYVWLMSNKDVNVIDIFTKYITNCFIKRCNYKNT